jgi:hypothetical protein
MAKRFTAIIIIANIIMGVLLYLSSQLVLSDFKGSTITSFNIFSIGGAPSQVPGQAYPPIAWSIPNYPIYVLLSFLVANACFIVVLIRQKR